MRAVDQLPRVQVGNTPTDHSQEVKSRVVQQKIDFIPNVAFHQDGHELEETKQIDELLSSLTSQSDAPGDLPAHLRRMCDAKLLTAKQERSLFQAMNYFKFRAAELRNGLPDENPDPERLAQIEALLSKAQAIRDHLIQANTRLVISIVKKFVDSRNSFDDLLSDGMMILMQAVEKFDYDRGFRFSTYAYRSIVRNAQRRVNLSMRDQALFSSDAEPWFIEPPDYRSSSLRDQMWGKLRELTTSMLDQLDRRERFIVRCRYALGPHHKTRTFQYLADKLGVSKERARQLEKRAVSKLQTLAAEHDLDELVGPAMI